MQTAFQPGAFQVSGFQIVAESTVTEQPTGGWAAFRGFEPIRRVRRKLEELREAVEEDAPVAEIEVELFDAAKLLSRPVRRAVRRAVQLQTIDAFRHAEVALKRFEQQEEEDFALLVTLTLH